MSRNIILNVKVQYINDIDPFCTSLAYPEPSKPFIYSFDLHVPLCDQISFVHKLLKAPHNVEDCTLQIFRPKFNNGDTAGNRQENDFGPYLDWDLSLAEQSDELCILRESSKTMLVLRTNICIRVRRIIEKLLSSNGRDLRRALFSLKQIFQDDKDLVHEFVQNGGLGCLIRLGSDADQSYQNYILRALGQIFLYIDGMNGVIAHNDTIQWLYSLLTSQFRLVVKTALKLLLVFVEYTDSNALLFLAAVYIIDKDRNVLAWSKLMYLLNDTDSSDQEMFIYAMTLINKTLSAVPDQDTYYDLVDSLEDQGMQEIIGRMQKLSSCEINEQINLYEKMLQREDDCESVISSPSSNYKVLTKLTNSNRRRRRHSVQYLNGCFIEDIGPASTKNNFEANDDEIQRRKFSLQAEVSKTQNLHSENSAENLLQNGTTKSDHQLKSSSSDLTNMASMDFTSLSRHPSLSPPSYALAEFKVENTAPPAPTVRPTSTCESARVTVAQAPPTFKASSTNVGAVHALAEKFFPQQQNVQQFSSTPPAPPPPALYKEERAWLDGGVDSQAEDGNSFAAALNKARSSMLSRSSYANNPPSASSPTSSEALSVLQRPESEIQWEKATQMLNRPLVINDLNFCELNEEDDADPLKPMHANFAQGTPPAPPPLRTLPLANSTNQPKASALPPPPPNFSPHCKSQCSTANQTQQHKVDNNLKTVKLFWKEAQVNVAQKSLKLDPPTLADPSLKTGVFWQRIQVVDIDIDRLVHLFETKSHSKEASSKKKDDKKIEIHVLDTKRSNAINIGLTKLPNPRAIISSVYKFDSTVLNKESIEKLLSTMVPTEDEVTKIREAIGQRPDVPLASAEHFLWLMAEIPALRARLKLWAFMLDYANLERELAEPLMDLKSALKDLQRNTTFQQVMATLLAVGNALNGVKVCGFQLEFLAKAHEVKDTINKNSLIFHVCSIVNERFPDSSDLFTELSSVVRCSKMDFDQELTENLKKLENECKSSWEHLKAISAVNATSNMQIRNKDLISGVNTTKISDFLTDCAQRIMILKIIHRRVFNRFRNFLLFMGSPPNVARETKINSICKTVAEFALEYRTCREKMLQQKKRLQEKRERNKTRGKLILETKQEWSSVMNQQTENHCHGRAAQFNVGSNGTDASVQRRAVQPSTKRADVRPNAGETYGLSSSSASQLSTSRAPSSGQRPHATGADRATDDDVGAVDDDALLDGLARAASRVVGSGDFLATRERRRARILNRKSARRTRTLNRSDFTNLSGSDDP